MRWHCSFATIWARLGTCNPPCAQQIPLLHPPLVFREENKNPPSSAKRNLIGSIHTGIVFHLESRTCGGALSACHFVYIVRGSEAAVRCKEGSLFLKVSLFPVYLKPFYFLLLYHRALEHDLIESLISQKLRTGLVTLCTAICDVYTFRAPK